MARGFFVGLVTLDCIYRVERVPTADEKLVAQDCFFVAGGPAANAAVTFASWGHETTLIAALGSHPLADLVEKELGARGVAIANLTPTDTQPPPLSTVLVTAATGERAVISRNALDRAAADVSGIPELAADIVLIDGHQMQVGLQLARQAQAQGIPIVVDAGSWKPGFDQVLALSKSAIASARFHPPEQSPAETLSYMAALGVPEIAVTHGPKAIHYHHRLGSGHLPVPSVPVQDTLGAGDIFHGAFCHYRLSHSFLDALTQAARVAAHSCRYFGPRTWLEAPFPA